MLFNSKDSIGRMKFTIIFFTTLIIYSAAAVLMNERDIFSVGLKLVLMLTSLFWYISVLIRRLHDIDKKGSDFFLLFIPVYGLYLLFLLFFKRGVNKS